MKTKLKIEPKENGAEQYFGKPRKRAKLTIEQRQKLQGIAFAAPWIAGILLFWIYPVLCSLVMSFFKITQSTMTYNWTPVGLKNYNRIILQDIGFFNQLRPYLIRTCIIVPIITLFALIIALLLNQKFYGRGLFRTLFFMPVLFTAGGVIINLLTTYGTGSATTSEVQAQVEAGMNVNTYTVSFLTNPAVLSMIQKHVPANLYNPIETVLKSFILILWYAGVQIVVLIAGIQSIPPSIYEAAAIDGATGWESLWKITLPGILPFIVIAGIYTIVDQFTVPSNPIMTFIQNADKNTLQGTGYAAAAAWIYQVMILAIVGLVFLIFRKSLGFKRREA